MGDDGGDEEARLGHRQELQQPPQRALGKDRPSLPASITGANGPTKTPMEAAEVMNQFFLDKVDNLGKKALLPRLPEETPDVAGDVLHVQQETVQVPQEATHITQEVAHVAQEVDDVLQEANDNTTSSSHVPPL
jgi:cell division protein FtsL